VFARFTRFVIVPAMIGMSCMTGLFSSSAFGQLITAHRGASHDAPENTLAAFQLAWEQGADAIEADFQVSSDGQIVCIHDADTKRVAGVKRVVAQTPLAALRTLDVGRWKAPSFAGERLPTLAEVLATVPAGKRFFIELKTGPEIVPKLVEEIEAAGFDPRFLTIIAFDAETVAACKRVLPAIKAHWLTSFKQNHVLGGWRPKADAIAATVKACGADGVGMKGDRRVVNRDFIDRLAAGGVGEFHVWTVDAPDDARAFRDLGAMGITTNRPAVIRAALTNPLVQAADGTIMLHGRDATVLGTALRYEPAEAKQTLGFWTRTTDAALWNFTVTQPGTFDVEVLQGCGKGQGGSEMSVVFDATPSLPGTPLAFTVEDTGGFQQFRPRVIGRVELAAGEHTLRITAARIAKAAACDIRQVRLVPVKP
jgi:glycerophosphoryl diester phosphodiesterase